MTSPIDKIFEDIYGYKPNKPGLAFEQLAAIATHIINGGDVKHDDKLRGEFSNSFYQLDIHHTDGQISTMGEVKDYTIQEKKVGRGDLQKLGGALPDLKKIDQGTFFSATGFTKPAKQYADAAEKITGKPIVLWGLRPSTEKDEQGFLKVVVLTMHIIIPQPQKARWLPHFTSSGKELLKTLIKDGENELKYNFELESFYNPHGEEILTLQQLTSNGYGEINSETEKSHASFYLPSHHIRVYGLLAEIFGLEYELPYAHEIQEIRITDDSENRFVLLDKDGNISNFISDKMLKGYEFDESGNLKTK